MHNEGPFTVNAEENHHRDSITGPRENSLIINHDVSVNENGVHGTPGGPQTQRHRDRDPMFKSRMSHNTSTVMDKSHTSLNHSQSKSQNRRRQHVEYVGMNHSK